MSAATDSGEDAVDAKTGGAAAETAPTEGASPQGDERPFRPCANCGHPRQDRFCPKCGQNDRDYVRSLPPLLGDILKETFELDSRIRRTLPPLFLRPGELPAEFSRNRRARYMSSVRLYLFTSIVFFFLLTLNDFRPGQLDREVMQERGAEAVRIEIEEARALNTGPLKALLPPPQQRKVDEIIARPGMVGPKGMIVGLAAHIEESPEVYEGAGSRYVLARIVDVAGDPGGVLSQFVENLPLAMFITLPAYALLLMFFFFGSHRFFTEHLVFAVQMHTFAFIVLAVSMLLPDEMPGAEREYRAGVPPVAQAFDDDAPATDPAIRIRIGDDADVQAHDDSAEEEASKPELGELRRRLGPEDDSWDVFDVLDLLLFLWLLAYHYLALRRYYGNGRFRTSIKWAVLTSAYCVLLIPGMALSAAFTVFQLR